MERDTELMRKGKPYVFSDMKAGQGVGDIIKFIKKFGMLEAI
jgi:urease accessory protein